MRKCLLVVCLVCLYATPCHGLDARWNNAAHDLRFTGAARCTLIVSASGKDEALPLAARLLWVAADAKARVSVVRDTEPNLEVAVACGVVDSTNDVFTTAHFCSADRGSAAPRARYILDVNTTAGLVFSVLPMAGICADTNALERAAKLPGCTINGGVAGSPMPPLMFQVASRHDGGDVHLVVDGYFEDGLQSIWLVKDGRVRGGACRIVESTRYQVRVIARKADYVDGCELHAVASNGLGSFLNVLPSTRDEVPRRCLVSFDRSRIELPKDQDWRPVASLGVDRACMGALDDVGVDSLRRLFPWRSEQAATYINDLGEKVVLDRVDNIAVIKVRSTMTAAECAKRLSQLPFVLQASPVEGIRLAATPDDPYYHQQWGLHNLTTPVCGVWTGQFANVRMPEAWDEGVQGNVARIGIIDSGHGCQHMDTANPYGDSLPSVSFVEGDPDPCDWNTYHGTAVASIASGFTNNGIAIAGVNWGGPFVSIKVTGAVPSLVALIDGIEHAAAPSSAIDIANMSVYYPMIDALGIHSLAVACRDAFYRGRLLVAAMGNDGDSSNANYPARLSQFVFSVGALLWDGQVWSDSRIQGYGGASPGSSTGSWISAVAPGGRLIQAACRYNDLVFPDAPGLCRPDQPASMLFGGTSAAAPVVSGIAGWLKGMQPSLTGEDLAQILRRTATDLLPEGFDPVSGYGLVRADVAAEYISNAAPHNRLIKHGVVGSGGSGALEIQGDSVLVAMHFSNTAVVGVDSTGARMCMRYHLRGHVQFGMGYVGAPDTWVRAATTMGLGIGTSYDHDWMLRWGGISAVDAEGMDLETYVYRIVGSGVWYPSAPAGAAIAYTAIGQSAVASVDGLGVAGLSITTAPNPVQSSVLIAFSLPHRGFVRGEVFDIGGRRVAGVVEGVLEAGRHEFRWKMESSGGERCRAGVYFCRVEACGRRKVVRIVVLGR